MKKMQLNEMGLVTGGCASVDCIMKCANNIIGALGDSYIIITPSMPPGVDYNIEGFSCQL